MYEVIRWVSIGMMLVAVCFNTCVAIRGAILNRKLAEQLKIWKARNEANEVKE